jgi:hypothetical protein
MGWEEEDGSHEMKRREEGREGKKRRGFESGSTGKKIDPHIYIYTFIILPFPQRKGLPYVLLHSTFNPADGGGLDGTSYPLT